MSKKSEAKKLDEAIAKSSNFSDSQQALQFLKKLTFSQVEQIPELRAMISQLMVDAETERRVLESFNSLPQVEVQKLFREYVESHFDSYLQSFFDSLDQGLRKVFRNLIHPFLEEINSRMREISSEILLAQISPYALVDSKIIQESREFLRTEPGYMASIYAIYKHLAYQAKVAIPGAILTEKYVYVIKLLRRTECFKEWNGFQIELVEKEFKDTTERYISSGENQTKILEALERAESTMNPESRGGTGNAETIQTG